MPLDRYPYMENDLKNQKNNTPIFYNNVIFTDINRKIQELQGMYIYYNGFVQLFIQFSLKVDFTPGQSLTVGVLDITNTDQPQKNPIFLTGLCSSSAIGQINQGGKIVARNCKEDNIPAGTVLNIAGVYYAE